MVRLYRQSFHILVVLIFVRYQLMPRLEEATTASGGDTARAAAVCAVHAASSSCL